MQEEKNSESDLDLADEIYSVVENLIALEEHVQKTAEMTKEEKYNIIASEIRKVRSKWQHKIWKNDKGQMWCSGKHMPVTSMHMRETAQKYMDLKDKNQAMDALQDAKDIKLLFFTLRGDDNGNDGQPHA